MDMPPPIVHEIVIDHQKVAAQHLATLSPDELDRDWKLDDFFGCVYVINLPKETERLKKITLNLHSIGMKTFTVFPAIDGKKAVPVTIWKKFNSNWLKFDTTTEEGRKLLDRLHKGEAGCYLSHYGILRLVKKRFDDAIAELKKAKARGNKQAATLAKRKIRQYSSVVILEDDNGFGIVNPNGKSASTTGCGTILRKAMQELPKDWDLLYFITYWHDPGQAVGENLKKIQGTLWTNAYAVHYTMYNDVIKHLKRIEDPNCNNLRPYDEEICSLIPTHKVFALLPSLAYQNASKSAITYQTKHHLEQH